MTREASSTPVPPGAIGERVVVVGYDGSTAAGAALRWAAHEAGHRRARLRALTAFEPGPVGTRPAAGIAHEETMARERAHRATEIVAATSGTGLDFTARTVIGRPARVLLEAARTAELLVVGSQGHLGILGALTGSLSRRCARVAPCPTVIVGTRAGGDPVLRILTSPMLDRDGDVSRWMATALQHRGLPVLVVDPWDAASGFASASRRPGDLLVIPRAALHDVPFVHETCPVLVLPPSPDDEAEPEDRPGALLGIL
jgi:nucleotide-binding universal stress UspA family protein